MDADMAMQLSRARSNTVVAQSPVIATPSPTRLSPELHHDETPFIPSLSLQEERDMEFARGIGHSNDPEEQTETFHPGPAPEAHMNHLSAGHDPSLLVALTNPEPDDMGGLPMYQANVTFQDQLPFDFTALESYAREEKRALGIVSPTTPTPPNGGLPSSHTSGSTVPPETNLNAPVEFTLPLPRARQRKLSQSAPGPRRGKMALFEHPSQGPPPSLAFRSPQITNLAGGQVLSAVPSYDNLPDTNRPGGPPLLRQATMTSGHDRPYRFSFYSNALSATIHARSLSELPAEGQSFEDLFAGVNGKDERPEGVNLSRPGTSMGFTNGPGPLPRNIPPIPIGERSGLSRMSTNMRDFGGIGSTNGKTPEVNTWWLDVQSPTDEEMKLLSKVNPRLASASLFPSVPCSS